MLTELKAAIVWWSSIGEGAGSSRCRRFKDVGLELRKILFCKKVR